MTYRSRTLRQAAIGLVLLAGLGLFAYYGAHVAKREEERASREARQVFRLDQEAVTRLVVESGGDRTVAERTGEDRRRLSTWAIVEPVAAEGDDIAINSLLGTIERLDTERNLSGLEGVDPKCYGLDPPRGKISLTTAEGKSFGLLIGEKSAFDDLLYVEREGEPDVLLVKGYLESSLLKKTFDLRGKNLLHIEKDRVRRLTLKGAQAAAIQLEKEGDSWRMLTPLQDEADRGEADKVVNALRNLRASSFPKAEGIPPSAYGLEPPAVTVEVAGGPEPIRQTLELGFGTLKSNQGRCFAKRKEPPGPLAEVPEYQLRSLQKTPFDLQAKAMLAFQKEEVFKISSVSDTELLVLEKIEEDKLAEGGKSARKEESWWLVSPKPANARKHKVSSFLYGLAELKATKLLADKQKANLAEFGLERPAKTIGLFDRDGKELAQLKIGKTAKDGTYVMGTARPTIGLVETKKIERFPDVKDLEEPPLADTKSKEKP